MGNSGGAGNQGNFGLGFVVNKFTDGKNLCSPLLVSKHVVIYDS